MPLTLGKLINVLEGRSDGSPLPYLFGYVGLRFLQGSGGLSAIRDVGFGDRFSFFALKFLYVVFLGSSDAIFRPRYVN
jgi:hypothetical protein